MNSNNRLFFISSAVFFQFIFIFYYLYINIKNAGGMGVGIPYVAVFYILSLTICVCLLFNRSFRLKPAFFLLAILLIWVAGKVFFDRGDLYYLKQITIATTGGILFFYFIGAFLSIGINEIIRVNSRYFNFIASFLTGLVIISFLFSYSIFIEFKSNLAPNSFVLKELIYTPQREADFLTILFLLSSILYFISSVFITYSKIKKNKLLVLMITTVYVITAGLCLAAGLMIKSNNSFVMVSGILVITLTVAYVIMSDKVKNIYREEQNTGLILTEFIFYKLIFTFIKILVFVGLLALVVAFYNNFQISELRILNFSEDSNSIFSRINIVKNSFLVQFLDSPWFGNFNVELETTGVGSYMHSFLLFSATHTGFVGFLGFSLLFVIIFMSFFSKKEKYFLKQKNSIEKSLRLFYFFLLLFVFLIANLATALSWPVIWFAVGIFGNLIYFQEKSESVSNA